MNGYDQDFYEYVRDHNHVFADVTGVLPATLKVIRDGAEEESVDGEYVAGNLFRRSACSPGSDG